MTALGTTPAFYSGALAAQAASLLAGELDERSRLPVIVIDEAHLLSNDDLEALRMLSNVAMDTESHFALLLIGQPTLRRRLKLAVMAALDQRIGTRYTLTGMSLEDTTDYLKGHLSFAGRVLTRCFLMMRSPPSTRHLEATPAPSTTWPWPR